MKWDMIGAMELSGMESGTSGQTRVLGGGVRQQGRDDGQVVQNPTSTPWELSWEGDRNSVGRNGAGREAASTVLRFPRSKEANFLHV